MAIASVGDEVLAEVTEPKLGKEAIVEAATVLFAERGVDGVSLGEIHRASGHRNRSATAYHFGGKDELVRALLTEIVVDHDQVRVERFDALDREGGPATLRQVLEASVSPLVDDLAERSTRLRVRMMANLVVDERYMGMTQEVMRSLPGLGRSTGQIVAHLGHLPDELRDERIVLATTFGLQAFADQARLMDNPAGGRRLSRDVFAAHVVVLLEAMLMAPLP